jgi:hypothetical protein
MVGKLATRHELLGQGFYCSIYDDDTIQRMNEIDETLVAEAGCRLAAAAPDAQVILFGSHGNEEANPHSDVAFLVVEPEVAMRQRSRCVCSGPCAICGCQPL